MQNGIYIFTHRVITAKKHRHALLGKIRYFNINVKNKAHMVVILDLVLYIKSSWYTFTSNLIGCTLLDLVVNGSLRQKKSSHIWFKSTGMLHAFITDFTNCTSLMGTSHSTTYEKLHYWTEIWWMQRPIEYRKHRWRNLLEVTMTPFYSAGRSHTNNSLCHYKHWRKAGDILML